MSANECKFVFLSKVIEEAMSDMNSHNYDRFSKVGSSSAFSGFMARKLQRLFCTGLHGHKL